MTTVKTAVAVQRQVCTLRITRISRDAIHLTGACAFVGRHVVSLDEYQEKKTAIGRLATAAAHAAGAAQVEVEVNPADGASEDSVYLAVTGTSAEAGDDGQVGRGNRVNGVISWARSARFGVRPSTVESRCGELACPAGDDVDARNGRLLFR